MHIADDGEAFFCQPYKAKSSPVKIESNRIHCSSSIFSKSPESKLAQSPPISSLLSNISRDKDETNLQAFPNTSPLNVLVKDKEKKDVIVEYCLERIPLVHRGQRVFTDSKSRGFAVLQVASNEGCVISMHWRPVSCNFELWTYMYTFMRLLLVFPDCRNYLK